uniref:Hypothetical plastid protein n=1 Tax=Gracilaria tenuistipitata var. liui TaxID=285951 RepID=Q6B8Z4_GRATL|nr:hypothetical plastid protein [Gracilaria tenuistipitata var. liui]AAT79641.1 hypothetical plastid protein [Gracilaria tenuistipitata var. liui]
MVLFLIFSCMYFYQKLDINLNNYYIFVFQYNFIFILVASSLSYEIISNDYLYFYQICNYNSSLFSSIMRKRFLKILFFIMMFYGLIIILEVKMNNFRALSLYYWLGFCVTYIRFDYYVLKSFTVPAYSLVNTKFISLNIFRRYLILGIY